MTRNSSSTFPKNDYGMTFFHSEKTRTISLLEFDKTRPFFSKMIVKMNRCNTLIGLLCIPAFTSTSHSPNYIIIILVTDNALVLKKKGKTQKSSATPCHWQIRIFSNFVVKIISKSNNKYEKFFYGAQTSRQTT
jgi:hypothetical protein